LAILNRCIQLGVILYIALYIVWWKQGYQEFQIPNGISIVKVKGLSQVNVNQSSGNLSSKIWDGAEYVIPPLENNAFFIATRQTVTYDQTEGTCPSAKAYCTTNADCPRGTHSQSQFGLYTGNCIDNMQGNYTCEIQGWCPEELSSPTATYDYLIDRDDLNNFTVYIKSVATFQKFKVTLRNIRTETNFSCIYDVKNNPHCPIFRIGNIIESLIDVDEDALLRDGGLIEIEQKWKCNFDFKPEKCYPTWEFRNVKGGDEKQAPGMNYRYIQKYRTSEGKDIRTLSKVYGIRFVITTTGQAGRFNIVNLFVAIGSGIGFMVIASIICDFVFLHFHQARKQYRQTKFSICEPKVTYEVPTSFENQNHGR